MATGSLKLEIRCKSTAFSGHDKISGCICKMLKISTF